jgi:hypothetical protein
MILSREEINAEAEVRRACKITEHRAQALRLFSFC